VGDANLNEANGPPDGEQHPERVEPARRRVRHLREPVVQQRLWLTISPAGSAASGPGGFWSNQIEALRHLDAPPSGSIC
jgi:hypothetical protein